MQTLNVQREEMSFKDTPESCIKVRAQKPNHAHDGFVRAAGFCEGIEELGVETSQHDGFVIERLANQLDDVRISTTRTLRRALIIASRALSCSDGSRTCNEASASSDGIR